MVYAILDINDERYVDNNIKLMEKVPELLRITGFFKSFLMSSGYKITFKIKRIMNIIAINPKRYLICGWISCIRLPSDNSARINPEIGMGRFLIMFILSKCQSIP